MTVLSSGVVIVSSGPMSEMTAPALSSGFRIRSNDILTAADVRRVPSWNFTPSRRVNVNFLPESSIVHFVASAGCGFWSASSVISVSTMFCAISPAAAPVVSAGSIESILSHCPQVSVPPYGRQGRLRRQRVDRRARWRAREDRHAGCGEGRPAQEFTSVHPGQSRSGRPIDGSPIRCFTHRSIPPGCRALPRAVRR